MMEYEKWSESDAIFSSDSCFTACGGFWNGCYFHAKFPDNILNQSFHIGVLEMLAIIISLKLSGQYFRGKRIVIFCENNSVCQVIYWKISFRTIAELFEGNLILSSLLSI